MTLIRLLLKEQIETASSVVNGKGGFLASSVSSFGFLCSGLVSAVVVGPFRAAFASSYCGPVSPAVLDAGLM